MVIIEKYPPSHFSGSYADLFTGVKKYSGAFTGLKWPRG
jgi:hypothetical protein